VRRSACRRLGLTSAGPIDAAVDGSFLDVTRETFNSGDGSAHRPATPAATAVPPAARTATPTATVTATIPADRRTHTRLLTLSFAAVPGTPPRTGPRQRSHRPAHRPKRGPSQRRAAHPDPAGWGRAGRRRPGDPPPSGRCQERSAHAWHSVERCTRRSRYSPSSNGESAGDLRAGRRSAVGEGMPARAGSRTRDTDPRTRHAPGRRARCPGRGGCGGFQRADNATEPVALLDENQPQVDLVDCHRVWVASRA
jgi:hypothetical protein